MDYSLQLDKLRRAGNFRKIPQHIDRNNASAVTVDFSSNDYLGLAHDPELRASFFESHGIDQLSFSASASRLLALDQQANEQFEAFLEEIYPGRKALLFNSGYHANTGLISAFADRSSLIIADRLVHASIIDGIQLSRARLQRFRHNDINHLEELVAAAASESYSAIVVIVESVYSMDGDRADLEALIDLKKRYPQIMLYVDEAHAFGVCGPHGLGLVDASSAPEAFDCVIATLGKAAASVGAFALLSGDLRDYAVNRARSLIFSTALPPLNIAWSQHVVSHILTLDPQRRHLSQLATELDNGFRKLEAKVAGVPSHIQPFIVGSATAATAFSAKLREHGLVVLPIRTPTVPAGTERLRISLSASLTLDNVRHLTDLITLFHHDFQ